MPYTETRGPYQIGYRFYKPTQQIFLTNQNDYAWLHAISKPSTVKRVKPADLFKNGTSRSWSESKQVTPFGQIYENIYDIIYGPLSRYCGVGQRHTPFNVLPWNALDGKLRAKIKDQNVNLAQSVAEYRQVSSMFYNAALDVVSAFRSIRSGRALKDFVRILKHPKTTVDKRIANRWLEYQYGLKPLISDIYGTLEFLSSRIRSGYVVYVRATHRETAHFSGAITGLGYNGKGSYVEKHQLSLRGVARYQVKDEKLRDLAQTGISNPALLAWELIPYSFVFDWFIPVGDWLSALDALNGVSDLWVQRGSELKVETTTTAFNMTARWDSLNKTRLAPNQNLSMPRLGYQPSFSLTRTLNGLALLTQLRRQI